MPDCEEGVFELEYTFDEADEQPEAGTTFLSSDDALITCVNRFGRVVPSFISALTGNSSYTSLLHELRGAVFQDPDAFKEGETWVPEKGWLLRDQYLCGNVIEKLSRAKEANDRFPCRFSENIRALQQIVPVAPEVNDIYVSLGATWIPEQTYGEFIKDLLLLRQAPSVHYEASLSRWFLNPGGKKNSTILTDTVYGTPDMPVYKIIEQSMNAKTVKVYDHIQNYNGKVENILNQNKTIAAQEKQQLILKRFNDWIHETDSRRAMVQEHYCSAYVGVVGPQFDGAFLRFPELNPSIRLYPHQKNAVARILLSDENVLLAHPVGAGKTFEIICAAHELKRMGLGSKNMVVVPNNILRATADFHHRLYPNDEILVIYPKDFIPAKRNEALRKARDGDYACIYIAYSSFDMIGMSKSYWIAKQQQEIRALELAASNSPGKSENNTLKSEIAKRKRALSEYAVHTPESPWLSYDHLGVDALFVDEAHNYKNIEIHSNISDIVGMHNKGSKKCLEMLEKCRSTKRIVFATGTPLTNSLADLFVMQTYLQEKDLRYRNIDSFDMWLNTFGERETNYEIDIDGKSLRAVTRFSSFHNLTELMSLFSSVCDFSPATKETCIPEFHGYTDIVVPINTPQKKYIRHLAERTELCRSHMVKRTEDNQLRITIHGLECGLDIRLVDTKKAKIDFTPREISSCKIRYCSAKAYSLYVGFPGTCQIIFCDIGTPKDGFNVYDELKKELTLLGVPPEEIEFIHNAKSEKARSELFQSVNNGKTRILIGSTPKLGLGVNVQEKLIALHHLSVPWRPADMVQREGRLLRRGNSCKEVFIYRYVTEGTFDSYSWQLLENKQRFIASFLSGTSASRDSGDVADTVLTYAEVKALAIGNPLIKKRVETSNRIDRERIASRQRQKQLAELRAFIEAYPERQRDLKRARGALLLDMKLYQDKKITIPIEERNAFGEELREALQGNYLHPQERFFDTYQGFKVLLPRFMDEEHPYVLLRGISGQSYLTEMSGETILGYSRRIDYQLNHLPDRLALVDRKYEDNQAQYQEATADLNAGNQHLETIEKLTRKLARIDEELNGSKETSA